ncbi:hypothetical protein [Planobispora longispora]|uniref:Uncharacterized protein n=1 Tax=Planobispora longispora TaxID=28887 RepID=A0A8J3W707_9ACTN|nr:hypothetical protein [Planobispora longispora]GIH79084.1 hypothetical protein Plo01_55130 [Planobispora longispora]
MGIGVAQGITLGISCLAAALGVYALVVKRVPRLAFLWRGQHDSRYYGWGMLSLAAFGLTASLGQDVMEPGSWPDTVMLVLSSTLFVAAFWLFLSARRAS